MVSSEREEKQNEITVVNLCQELEFSLKAK